MGNLFKKLGNVVEQGFKDVGNLVADPVSSFLDKGQDVIDQLSGKAGEKAFAEAAEVESGFQQQIIDLLKPELEFRQEQLGPLGESATAEGFTSNIESLLSGGTLDPLIAQRQRGATQAASSAGLRRSGGAIREAAAIPTDVAFNIENELRRRRERNAQIGQVGITGTTGAIGNLGAIQSGAITGGAGARAAGTSGILNLITGVGAGIVGRP